MGIYYKIDVLAALKAAGYSTYRLRTERIVAESTLQKIRDGKNISTATLDVICTLLNCQPGDIIGHNKDEKK